MVYLMMGIVPAVAMRDVQILQLVGQLAMCDRELQNVSDIIQDNLASQNIDFPGWSGIARRTAAIYNLKDPLDLFNDPWESHRWSKHAKKQVIKYWTKLLIDNAESRPSLDLIDMENLSLTSPHPIWTAARSNPVRGRQPLCLG